VKAPGAASSAALMGFRLLASNLEAGTLSESPIIARKYLTKALKKTHIFLVIIPKNLIC
jgi:hypothetical protein